MSSSAPLDSYDVQCVKCFSPLKDGERFCAVCGWDQEPWLPEPEKPRPGEVDIELDLDAPDTLPPAEYEASLKQESEALAGGGLAVMGAAASLPGAVAEQRPFWQQEANDAAGPSRWSRRIPVLLVSLAVAFGVAALALVVDHFYFDKQSEYGKLRDLKSSVAQVRAALRRGDLPAAERMLDALDADHSDDVGVQKLREELDQREEALAAAPAPAASLPPSKPQPQAQAQAQPQPQPQPAPAPSPKPVVEVASPLSQAAVAAPAPVAATGDEKPCNAALAAMSLCPKPAPAQAAPEAAPPP